MRLRPLAPPAGGLEVPVALAGLPRQAGTGPGVGLADGTPSLGTARGGRPGASRTLLLLCARPSYRSRDIWPVGRWAISILPARALRLDVALGMAWSARALGRASSSPRKVAVAPVRVRPEAGLGARARLLCSRLDLRTGGAGGATPPGLGKKPPLGAMLFLLPGEPFRLVQLAAASATASPQDVAGVVTPSVVAPRRSGGIQATASGLRPALATAAQTSTTLWAQAGPACASGRQGEPGVGLGAAQSSARSSHGSSNRPLGLGGLWPG